jgi:hypothetical protein
MIPRSMTARDAGLALISRINRWLIAGAVAFSGLISLAAAQAFHGRSLSTAGSSASPSSSSSPQAPVSNSGGGGDGTALSQPAAPPAAAPSAPSAPVVSGGS